MAFREQIEIEWKSLYTAPRPQGNDFYSKPFLVLGAFGPFPCHADRQGRVYDLTDVSPDGEYDELTCWSGLLWCEMPKPSADLQKTMKVGVVAVQTYHPGPGKKKRVVSHEFYVLEEAAAAIGKILEETGHQFHAEARQHILEIDPGKSIMISHEDYSIEVKNVMKAEPDVPLKAKAA
ncbi:MAG: hypothetical protein CMN74_02170 [Sphingorhabdus sp.]|nr:hypothetical protein [Sphingorhabdus sp.]|tara:strand:- start:17 stop:550 length:534 start_codon:yes stop_codon:yes gene_type:complete